MSKPLEATRKFQTYKQRLGHDTNGIRPVMIPDDSGEWVNHHAAEHLAEQLKRAHSHIAVLEAASPPPLAVTVPNGWVMVPKEPTEDMIIAGFESEPDEFFSEAEEWEKFEAMSGCEQAAHKARLCWSAMIVVAQKLTNEPK